MDADHAACAVVWARTALMHVPRFAHTATLLPDGDVLVAGGGDPQTGAELSSAEIYQP